LRVLIDTNVAIHLRDGDPDIVGRIAALDEPPTISIVTRIELEGGLSAKPHLAEIRRRAQIEMLDEIVTLDFEIAMVEVYRRILGATGYSCSRVLDRMIAATAIVHGLTLITINGADFRDIPGLSLEIWPSPAPQ
jgi:tRNA(fMet)-specific endonuclease VapC